MTTDERARQHADLGPDSQPDSGAIWLVGVSRRSGTNHLASVLSCHPSIGSPSDPVRETPLLAESARLERYVRRTARRWPHRWGDRTAATSDLRDAIGHALEEFVVARSPAERVVAKTPDPAGLRRLPDLLPDATVVLLVRDGRSVVESLVHGFGYSYSRAIREFRDGARSILRFIDRVDRSTSSVRWRMVRFEDVVADRSGTLSELCGFLGLDPDAVDPERVAELPVLGSSFRRPEGASRVGWSPVDQDEDFSPTERHATWPRSRHEWFARVAGREQEALGYPIDVAGWTGPAAVGRHLGWLLGQPAVTLRERGRDRFWRTVSDVRRITTERPRRRRSGRRAAPRADAR